MESLMIELYLHRKIYSNYFPGRPKHAKLRKSMNFTFWVSLLTRVVEVMP